MARNLIFLIRLHWKWPHTDVHTSFHPAGFLTIAQSRAVNRSISSTSAERINVLFCSTRGNFSKTSCNTCQSFSLWKKCTNKFRFESHFSIQQECLSALCRATFNIVVYAGNDFNWLLHVYTICNLLWLKNYRMIFLLSFSLLGIDQGFITRRAM